MKIINNNIRKLIVTVSVTALFGCGSGGGGSSDSASVGVFTDSPVEGLQYSGPSYSGKTNSKGEFNYKPGETVKFSIGGIELGFADGAPIVTPFSLFGLTPPTTETEIRAELAKPVSDFHRAMNIIYILVTLDKDQNPNNNLDLNGLDELLAAVTMDVDGNAFQFPEEFWGNLEEIDLGIDFDEKDRSEFFALQHFYQTQNIQIPVKALKKTSVDFDNNDSIDYVREITFSTIGQILQERTDNNNDGNNEYLTVYAFDENGYEITSNSQSDSNSDGTLETDYFNDRTYDGDGRRLTETRGQRGASTAIYTYSNTWTYDANGNQTKYTHSYDGGNDGIDRSEEVTSTYNDKGEEISRKEIRDNDGDGSIDYVSNISYSLDDNGNTLVRITTRDNDNDGTIDYKQTETDTYDGENNRLTSLEETDEDNDGTIDMTVSQTSTYDAVGNRLSIIDKRGTDGDGTYEAIYTYSYSYDGNGNQLTRNYQRDDGGDGSIDYINKSTQTFDQNSNRLSSLETIDNDGDGNIDSKTTYLNTYDANGNRLTESYESDSNNDGLAERSHVRTESYDSNDNRTFYELSNYTNEVLSGRYKQTSAYDDQSRRTSRNSEEDYNGDGAINRTESENSTFDANGKITLFITEYLNATGKGTRTTSNATYTDAGVQTSLTTEVAQLDEAGETTSSKVTTYSHSLSADNTIVATTEAIDNENDGEIDETNVTSYEYETIQNGLEYLLGYGFYQSVECRIGNSDQIRKIGRGFYNNACGGIKRAEDDD